MSRADSIIDTLFLIFCRMETFEKRTPRRRAHVILHYTVINKFPISGKSCVTSTQALRQVFPDFRLYHPILLPFSATTSPSLFPFALSISYPISPLSLSVKTLQDALKIAAANRTCDAAAVNRNILVAFVYILQTDAFEKAFSLHSFKILSLYD